MLVDVVSHASGQTFCVPRRQAEGGYLTATKERTCSLGWDCDDTLCDHGDDAPDMTPEAADEIKRLRADLAVVVGALRDMDLAIYDDGCHIVNHAEFEAESDTLRRLLTEEP